MDHFYSLLFSLMPPTSSCLTRKQEENKSVNKEPFQEQRRSEENPFILLKRIESFFFFFFHFTSPAKLYNRLVHLKRQRVTWIKSRFLTRTGKRLQQQVYWYPWSTKHAKDVWMELSHFLLRLLFLSFTVAKEGKRVTRKPDILFVRSHERMERTVTALLWGNFHSWLWKTSFIPVSASLSLPLTHTILTFHDRSWIIMIILVMKVSWKKEKALDWAEIKRNEMKSQDTKFTQQEMPYKVWVEVEKNLTAKGKKEK